MDLSKKVFGANVDQKIIEYINQLQQGRFEVEPNSPISVSYDTDTYLGERTPFARMWTAVDISELEPKDNKWEKVGDSVKKVFILNDNKYSSYDELDSIDSGTRINELSENTYLKPVAGITDLSSESKGAIGALRQTTVKFDVHNRKDFENIFLPFFLKPGSTVFVDFGWSDKALSLYDPIELVQNSNLEMKGFYEKIFEDDDDNIKKSLMTTVSGQVIKYDVNVDENGSFKCTLEFVSSNYALLDKSISEDNDLKFIFDNSIEELLLGYYLSVTGVNPDGLINAKSADLAEKDKSELIKEFFDGDTKPASVGKIDAWSKKAGIFYQNISQGVSEDDALDKKESLFISFGLFEDKFLNQFISFWESLDDSGNPKPLKESKTQFTPSFYSKDSYVRWDSNLEKLQLLPFQTTDEKLSYLYPDTWENEDTYNKDKPFSWISTKDDKDKRRIPLRELFISVPLIAESFKGATNVNDALENLFDTINNDSGNIINIKMSKVDDKELALTFQDINVEADKFGSANEQILTFDVTSGNTIVQKSDLKFETPKAGLSSMIAIGNLSQPTVFDSMELLKFNFLNSITQEIGKGTNTKKKYQIKHLPVYGDLPTRTKAVDVNFAKLIEGVDVIPSSKKEDTKKGFRDFKKARAKKIKELSKDKPSTTKETASSTSTQIPGETEDGKQILYATSDRDFCLLNAKVNNFVKSGGNTISPVLPLSLDIEVYGNNFLGIGDFFTTNYLPQHYRERVYFQILGVNHTISNTSWSTSYKTIMRLKPDQKLGTGNNQVVVLYHPTLKSLKVQNIISNNKGGQKNPALETYAVDVKPKDTVKIQSNFALPKDITNDDVPVFTINRSELVLDPDFQVGLDADKRKEKYDKLKKENSFQTSRYGNLVSTIVNISEFYTIGTLAYHMALSELLLGEDIINWSGKNEKGQDLIVKPFFVRNFAQIYANQPVYVLPATRKGKPADIFKQRILEKFDQPGGSWGLDDFQAALYDFIKTNRLVIKRPSSAIDDTRIKNSKEERPFFLRQIDWKMESNWANPDGSYTFSIFDITGHADVKISPTLIIPTPFLKVSDEEFLKLLHTRYVVLRANISDWLTSKELEDARVNNNT